MSKKEWSPALAGGVSDPRNETVMKMFSLIDLWTYVQRVYGRTSLGAMDVRPEGACTYVHRPFERW